MEKHFCCVIRQVILRTLNTFRGEDLTLNEISQKSVLCKILPSKSGQAEIAKQLELLAEKEFIERIQSHKKTTYKIELKGFLQVMSSIPRNSFIWGDRYK